MTEQSDERGAPRLAVCDQQHGHEDNPATVYGHHGSTRTCIRVKATGQWVYDPAWERKDQPPRMPVQPPPPPYIPAGGGSRWTLSPNRVSSPGER